MLYIKIHYGLGNQIFQYALARRLSIEKNIPFKLDTTFYDSKNTNREYLLNKFSIVENIASDRELHQYHHLSFTKRQLSKYNHSILPVLLSNYFIEKNDSFDPLVFKCTSNTYLMGYWQDERYFKPIESIIRKDFTFKEQPHDNANIDILKMISKVNAVSLHVRRTDYITDSEHNSRVGVCDLDYYKNAIQYINERIDNPYIFVFSDDIEWTKKNLLIENNHIYVDHNNIDNGIEDLRLMIACKYHIIANSSFSWWGAWLSNNPNKIVIAPKIWQKVNNENRKLPKEWIQL